MKLYRIGLAGKTWNPDDMTGAGPAQYPGRWNDAGQYVVYAAPTLAMAVLETSAHIDIDGLPLNRYVVEIDVPDQVWNSRKVIPINHLPGGWDAVPKAQASTSTGSSWYQAGQEALLELPSAIVPEETLVIINCKHADATNISATTTRKFYYQQLFRL